MPSLWRKRFSRDEPRVGVQTVAASDDRGSARRRSQAFKPEEFLVDRRPLHRRRRCPFSGPSRRIDSQKVRIP